jgi:hypothetical protein
LCVDPESADEMVTQRIQFDVKAGLESNNSTLTINRVTSGKSKFALIDKTLLSAGVDAMFSFKKTRLLAVAGLYYYQQNFYKTSQVFSDHISIDKVNLDYSEILVPVAVQFSLVKKERSVLPYLKAGVSIPITLKSSLVWEKEQEYANAVFFERYALPQKLEQSPKLTISAGATFKLIGDVSNILEVSFLKGKGQLKDNTGSATLYSNRLVVLLGIRF